MYRTEVVLAVKDIYQPSNDSYLTVSVQKEPLLEAAQTEKGALVLNVPL